MDPAYKAYGLFVWDSGETGTVERVYAEQWNTAGLGVFAGTPLNVDLLTVFNCKYTAIHLLGTALNTLNFGLVSVDDCPTVFTTDPWNSREAGGTISVQTMKIETCVTSESRDVWEGTIVAILRGQFAFNVQGIHYTVGFCKTPCLFVVDPKLTNGTLQTSTIHVQGINASNVGKTLQDVYWKRIYNGMPNYSDFSFFYTSGPSSTDSRCVANTKTVTYSSTPCKNRLGFIRTAVGGNFSWTNCTPVYSYTQ